MNESVVRGASTPRGGRCLHTGHRGEVSAGLQVGPTPPGHLPCVPTAPRMNPQKKTGGREANVSHWTCVLQFGEWAAAHVLGPAPSLDLGEGVPSWLRRLRDTHTWLGAAEVIFPQTEYHFGPKCTSHLILTSSSMF